MGAPGSEGSATRVRPPLAPSGAQPPRVTHANEAPAQAPRISAAQATQARSATPPRAPSPPETPAPPGSRVTRPGATTPDRPSARPAPARSPAARAVPAQQLSDTDIRRKRPPMLS